MVNILQTDNKMNKNDLLKYSRQIILTEVGIEGQEKLSKSHAIILGLGGLGSPVSLYLVASGLGEITLVDDDKIEISNLQRQVLYAEADIGKHKTIAAKEKLKQINPECKINLFNERFQGNNLKEQIKASDIVIDCSDNFSTRFSLNSLCKNYKKPLISGAAMQWSGQISSFTYEEDSACYRCIFDRQGEEEVTCSNNGIISPLVGIVGSMQALETIKILCGIKSTLKNKLLIFNGLYSQWKIIDIRPDPKCSVCGNKR